MSKKITTRRQALPEEIRKGWSRTYATTRYDRLPWFSSTADPWVMEAVKSRSWRKGARVLDVGCGAGTNSLYLARAGYRVSGVDVADGAIAAARARADRAGLAVDFQVADALRLPFPEGSFDGVIDIGCFHTLPLELRRDYSRELYRVLRPGGTYALSWAAREWVGEPGPPHRLSVEEGVQAFEEEFLFQRIEFRGSGERRERGAGRRFYCALLRRRSDPRPPPR